ncbi:uncharacterized protein LY89DRAFT_686745 [Mollisia scopiformis]|uniref:Uncharacterized protein n=1 Tax=Mollisia scopiformis TaxID=149040 RepID=A0A194X220_MOLSC|nr:uncharacterized protein LY89DRAFT_686745 [Mollisia scopiformis]KUJ14241.1 hypothetical protein LY89DRAFT_686745 [Mollisia scopiformis]
MPTRRTKLSEVKVEKARDDWWEGNHRGGCSFQMRLSKAPVPAPKMELEDIDDGVDVSRRDSAFTYDNPF